MTLPPYVPFDPEEIGGSTPPPSQPPPQPGQPSSQAPQQQGGVWPPAPQQSPYYTPSWASKATGPGQPPYMALGWKNLGTTEKPQYEPDYGPGWQGYIRKIFARVADPKIFNPDLTYNEQTYIDTRAKRLTTQIVQKYPILGSVDDYVAAALRVGGYMGGGVINTPEGLESAEGEEVEPKELILSMAKRAPSSALAFGGRAFWAGFETLGQALFMIGEQPIRKMFSNSQAVDDIAEDYGVILPRTEFFGRTQRASYMDILHQPQELWSMGRLAQAKGDKIVGAAAIAGAVLSVIPTVTTSMLAKQVVAGAVALEGTDRQKMMLERRWNSSGAIYSMLVDEARYREFSRRYEAGDRPDILTEQLMNPWIELGFGLAFDLTNVVMPGYGKLRTVRNAVEELEKPGTKLIAEALSEMAQVVGRGAGEMPSQNAFVKLTKAIEQSVDDVGQHMVEIASDYSLFAPDADGKAWAAVGRQARLINLFVRQAVRNGRVDEAADLMGNVIRWATSEGEARLAAVAGIYNHELGKYMLSKSGLEMMSMTKRLLTTVTPEGVEKVSPRAARLFLDQLADNAGNVEDMANFLTTRVKRVTEEMYPSMDRLERAYKAEKAGQELSRAEKIMAQRYAELSPVYSTINKAARATGPAYDLYNRFFGMIYMGLSPGYAMRNMLTNTVVILADNGATTALKSIGYGLAEQLPKRFGPGAWFQRRKQKLADMMGIAVEALPEWATQGITIAGGEGSQFRRKGFIAVAQRFEAGASMAIVEDVVRREIKNALRSGVLPSADSLIRGGMNQQGAQLLIRKMLDYGGNIDKALAEFYKASDVDTQLVDVWRHMEVPSKWREAMEHYGLWDDFLAMRANPDTTQAALKAHLGDVLRDYKRAAGLGRLEGAASLPGSLESRAAALVTDISEAANLSVAKAERMEMFDQMLQSFRASRDLFTEGVDGFLSRLREQYPQIPREMWDTWRKKISITEKLGDTYYPQADALRSLTRNRWLPGVKGGNLQAVWESVSYRGEDLGPWVEGKNKHEVYSAIWDFYFEQQRKLWLAFNEQVKNDSWDVLKDAMATIEQVGLEAPRLDDEVTTALARGLSAFEEGKAFASSENLQQVEQRIRMATPEDVPAYWFNEGVVPATATLDDLHPLYLRMFGWDRGKRGLFNAVNADRKIAGMTPYTEAGEVLFSEAVDALRRRVIKPEDMTDEMLRVINGTLGSWNADAAVQTAQEWAFRVGNTKERKLLATVNADIRIAVADNAEQAVLNDLEKTRRALVKAVYDRVVADKGAIAGAQVAPGLSMEKAAELLKEIEAEFAHVYQRNGEIMPSINRAMLEQLNDFARDTRRVMDGHLQNWDVRERVPIDGAVRETVEAFAKVARDRMGPVRSHAMVVAEQMRHFALHPYTGDKRYYDLALSKIMPYHYWYSRTYLRMFERLMWRPAIIAMYAKYRRAMERAHAGMPDWWKYNLRIDSLPGIDLENPLFFNLEATLNPINGLTGVDFNDPNKRVTWYARAVDDLSKFGPSLLTPINWVVAGALWMQGEEEFNAGRREDAGKYYGGAQRWLGRLIPQTATLKTFLGKVGTEVPFIGGYETDPFVVLFMGGYDPYERRQLTRALSDLVASGQITEEQALDAAYQQKGDIWQLAARNSLSNRFSGQMMSFFMGVGFRPRTPGDLQVDQFYNDYFRVTAMGDNMSPVDYQREMEGLRQKYPFMDTVLLGRKSDADRDAAYAYTVFSRIPPGMTTEVFEAAGIDHDLVNKFYDSKGNFDNWKQEDINRFMAATIDIGVTMAMPRGSTKFEWLDAREAYNSMQSTVKAQLGAEIWDKVDVYYDIYHENRNKAADFLEMHPDVKQALDMRTQLVMNNPSLFKYYGGLETYRRFYEGQMRGYLEGKYGSDIGEKWQEYYDLQLWDDLYGTRSASAFKKSHPEMTEYSKEKAQWTAMIERQIVAYADKMGNAGLTQLRSDFDQPTNIYQQQIVDVITPPPTPSWREFQQYMSEPLERLLIDYFNGAELSYAAENELDYQASRLGYDDGQALLQAIGIAYRNAFNP